MRNHEYVVGLPKHELDTPSLLVDVPVVHRNLEKMNEYFKGRQTKLRPHVKLHRASPVLAHLQLEASETIGLTCAKLSEAERLAQAGIENILIANQVVGARKIRRLIQLAKSTQVMVAVDSYDNIADLSEAAQDMGTTLRVLVEVNIGQHRCGVAPYEPAVQMAQAVHDAPGLQLMGLMGYDGHCTRKLDVSEREACSRKAAGILVGTRESLESAGLPVEVVSASGTYTYKYVADMNGITEIQAGTYLLMDTTFRESGVTDFECALTVLGTVTSRPSYPGAEDIAIIDVGRKTLSPYYGLPKIKSPDGAKVVGFSQEHGRVKLKGESRNLKVGDKVELWVNDANGTIILFNQFYAIRDGVVEAVWDIPGVGCAT